MCVPNKEGCFVDDKAAFRVKRFCNNLFYSFIIDIIIHNKTLVNKFFIECFMKRFLLWDYVSDQGS